MTDDYHLQEIRNYYPVDDYLATAGQPELNQLEMIQNAGFTRVINLALPDSPHAVDEEAETLCDLGLDYIHIPVDFKSPEMATLHEFFHVMQQEPKQKTFVHCAYNWRVSCFVFLYRTLQCDIPLDTAWQDLLQVWQPDPVWKRFIDIALASNHSSQS